MDAPVLMAPAPGTPPVLAVRFVRVAVTTDVLSCNGREPAEADPRTPWQVIAPRCRVRGRHAAYALPSIARRVKCVMTLSTSGQNGLWEAIFVFDCYNRRMGLPSPQTSRQASTKMKYQERIPTRSRHQVGTADGARYDDWMADVTTALAPTLTAADRCDRCGARAYVRACLISGGELLFCAHHGREHLPKLQDLTTDIQDETDRLTPVPVGVDQS